MKCWPSSSWLKEKQLQLNLAQLLSSRSSQLKLAQSLSWVEPAQAGSIWLNTPWAGSAQLSSKKPDRVSAQLNGWARCKMPAQRTLRYNLYFTKPNQNWTAKPNQTKWLWPPKPNQNWQSLPNQTKLFSTKPNQKNFTKANLTNSNQNHTNKTKINQTKPDQNQPNQTGFNQVS